MEGPVGLHVRYRMWEVRDAHGLLIASTPDWAEALAVANREAGELHTCTAKAMLSGTMDEAVMVCGHGVRLPHGTKFRMPGGSVWEVDETWSLPRPISQAWALGKPIAFGD